MVEAESEDQAREVGYATLHALYADLRERIGKYVPIDIRTMREATTEEIELWNWHHQMLATETMNRIPRQGDRIRLLAMTDAPNPIQVGQLGTIVSVSRHGGGKDAWHQIDVAWDKADVRPAFWSNAATDIPDGVRNRAVRANRTYLWRTTGGSYAAKAMSALKLLLFAPVFGPQKTGTPKAI